MEQANAGGMRCGGGRLVAVLALCGFSLPAFATGFYLNQQTVQGLARTDAGNAAAATDASTVYFNPAGLAFLWRDGVMDAGNTQFAIGAHLIVPTSDHLNANSTAATAATGGAPVRYAGPNASDPTNATPVPNLFVAHRLDGGNAFVGLGITSPFGLAAKFNSDWFGRYDSIETSLRTINVSAVGAYRITPTFAIGGGLDMQYARTKSSSAIPNPLNAGGPTAATDARIESTGSTWTPGFNVGVMWQAAERTRVGLHYRSEMRHKITGTTVTSGFTGALAAGNGATGANALLKLPQIVSAGVSHEVNGKLTLYGEVDWFGWGTLNEIRLRFDNGTADAVRPASNRNTFAYAIGAEYKQSADLTLRAGVQLDYTPTVDGFRDTTFPDANRLNFAAGASYRLSQRTWLDFAVNHVKFRTAEIAVTRQFFGGTALASSATVNDVVTPRINTLSAQLRYAF